MDSERHRDRDSPQSKHLQSTAVAEGIVTAVAGEEKTLDVYEGHNCPGQHWAAYRSASYKEPENTKNLEVCLVDLLTPSTSEADLRAMANDKKRATTVRICGHSKNVQVRMVGERATAQQRTLFSVCFH